MIARSFTPQLLAATLLATASFGTDFWPLEYSFEETYVGEATVARGAKRVEDFDESIIGLAVAEIFPPMRH